MRHILHADFDAFYAAVEQQDNPRLRCKPVVVGGNPEDRGVVASASYEARRFGVRSAMPMRAALYRCPQAIVVSPRFDRYRTIAHSVMLIFRGITDLVEPLSLDEAYLDVTESVTLKNTPTLIAQALKERIRTKIGLTISVGVATNKSIAKIASDMDKPDGLTIVSPGSERRFLAPLGVEKLWGVGPKTTSRLAAEDIHTIGEMALQSDSWFRRHFGRTAAHLRLLTMGQDDRPVVVGRKAKSVSAETTLAHDTGAPEFILQLIGQLSLRVSHRLSRDKLKGRTIKVKLRLADFTTFSRQRTFAESVQSPQEISTAASDIVRSELWPGRSFRLVGVSVSGFVRFDVQARQLRLTGLK